MAKPKRLWSELAPSTKARYRRYNVTPQQYNAGKISTGFRQTIFGKGGDSFAVQRAKQAGLDKILHEFDALPKSQREQMADLWLKGRTAKNKPMHYLGNGAFELEATDMEYSKGLTDSGDTIVNQHYGKPLLNTDIVNAQMTMDDWWQRIGADEMTDEDWEAFKLAYNASFTK
jgi:hypothetical protein